MDNKKVRLLSEKDEIISEFNYHDIQKHMISKGEDVSISSIRKKLDELLTDFIDAHLERKTVEIRSGHWIIGLDYNYDVEEPSLHATYSVEITSYVSSPRD